MNRTSQRITIGTLILMTATLGFARDSAGKRGGGGNRSDEAPQDVAGQAQSGEGLSADAQAQRKKSMDAADAAVLAKAQEQLAQMQQKYAAEDAACERLRENVRAAVDQTKRKLLQQELKQREKVAKQLKKNLHAQEKEVKRLSKSVESSQ